LLLRKVKGDETNDVWDSTLREWKKKWNTNVYFQWILFMRRKIVFFFLTITQYDATFQNDAKLSKKWFKNPKENARIVISKHVPKEYS
jgi:hypothetical protein